MISIEANGIFSLGRQGENEYRQIEFDITDLLDGMDLTGAEVVCLLERPHSAPIICNEFTYDLTEKTAVLTVTSAETANSGRCRLELDLVIGDVVGKTQIFACNVLPALGEPTTCTGEIPWVSEVLEASEQAQASAQSASASAQEAQEIADELADTIGTAVEEYLEEHPITAPVQSVNAKIGDVVLDASDVHALPDSTVIPTKTSDLTNDSGYITSAPVSSVNGKTGAVSLNASDVGALPSSTAIPTKTSQLQNDSGFLTSAPVSSVNGQTGDVTITASGLGAYVKPSGGIPKTDLASAVQTSLGKADTALQSAPVTSVNGQTGAVVIPTATTSADGLMSSADKALLDSVTERIASTLPVNTVTGAMVSVEDGADNIPVKDLAIAITPTQSGSGDPSPDNVRPISGWTGANVHVNDDVIAIDWQSTAGTVYGGSLDVTTGVLTVDRAMVDLGTLNWGANYTAVYSTTINDILPAVEPPYANRQSGAICSAYAPDSQYSVDTTMTDKRWLRTAKKFFVKDTSYADAASFKTAMNGVQLVYELATPQTYQLTPTEVSTLLGANNVWADTGDTTLTYRASLQPVYDDYSSALIALNGE